MARNNHDLAHGWAHQLKDEDKGSSFFYVGPKIYSFGRHFCIARILPSGVVAYGTHRWSGSYTSRHQSLALSAVSHMKKVYCHDPDASAMQNRETALKQIAAELIDGENPRKKPHTRAAAKARAIHLAEQFNEYLAAIPDEEVYSTQPIDLAQFDAIREEAQKAKALAEAAEKERAKRAAEEGKVKLDRWRRHDYQGYLGMYVPDSLRLSKDGENVETSRGAFIPVSHAKRLWPLVENCRAIKQGITGRDIRVGHYIVSEVRADGSIRVGCHDIAYSEIEGIAKALGLLEEDLAQDGQGK
jgi:hypothetical protein